jgi:hypothetical protein
MRLKAPSTREGWQDLMWVLVNSQEFLINYQELRITDYATSALTRFLDELSGHCLSGPPFDRDNSAVVVRQRHVRPVLQF